MVFHRGLVPSPFLTPSSRGSSPESSGSENRRRRRPKRRLSSDSSNEGDVTPTSQTPLKMTKVGEWGMSEEPSSSPVGSDGESLISVVTASPSLEAACDEGSSLPPRSTARRNRTTVPKTTVRPKLRPAQVSPPPPPPPPPPQGVKKESQGSTFQPTQRTRGSQLRGPLVGASSSKEPERQPL